jgi:hypothetical protein
VATRRSRHRPAAARPRPPQSLVGLRRGRKRAAQAVGPGGGLERPLDADAGPAHPSRYAVRAAVPRAARPHVREELVASRPVRDEMGARPSADPGQAPTPEGPAFHSGFRPHPKRTPSRYVLVTELTLQPLLRIYTSSDG